MDKLIKEELRRTELGRDNYDLTFPKEYVLMMLTIWHELSFSFQEVDIICGFLLQKRGINTENTAILSEVLEQVRMFVYVDTRGHYGVEAIWRAECLAREKWFLRLDGRRKEQLHTERYLSPGGLTSLSREGHKVVVGSNYT